MVEFEAFWDRTYEQFVGEPMNLRAAFTDAKLAVSASVAVANPQPARVGDFNTAPEPDGWASRDLFADRLGIVRVTDATQAAVVRVAQSPRLCATKAICNRAHGASGGRRNRGRGGCAGCGDQHTFHHDACRVAARAASTSARSNRRCPPRVRKLGRRPSSAHDAMVERLTLNRSATSFTVSTSSRFESGVPSGSWVTPTKIRNTQFPVKYRLFHRDLWKPPETLNLTVVALVDPNHAWVPDDSFAARLVLIRKQLGLSQEEAATRCGLKPSTWFSWENDAARPRILFAKFINEVYGLEPGTVEALLEGQKPPRGLFEPRAVGINSDGGLVWSARYVVDDTADTITAAS